MLYDGYNTFSLKDGITFEDLKNVDKAWTAHTSQFYNVNDEIGYGIIAYNLILLLVDVAMTVLIGYVAYKLLDYIKSLVVVVFVIILYLKQIFNTIFKIYLSYELVFRMNHHENTAPDQAFYGLWGFTSTLFMICIAVNTNLLYHYYTKVKMVGEIKEGYDNDTYRMSKLLLGWFTCFLFLFSLAAGISVIKASSVNMTPELLG